jgi:excisionase family DNA binding protein
LEELSVPLVFVPKSRTPKVSTPRGLKLFTVAEAAHYTKVSTQTLRRAMKAGRLKFYRAGRQIRIDESDLVNYPSS